MAMDFGRVLDLIERHIGEAGHEWVIAGGLAMHGHSRTTQDLDVIVEASARDRVLAFMESEGYETLHASAGFSNHVHREPGLGRIDFIYVDAGTAQRVFPRCVPIGWKGRSLRVPSPEHLIAMKVHAMKNDPSRTFREMADIQYLLGLKAVDRTRARRYFELAGLEERFDELLRIL
jgi:hypothetical protein